MYNNKQKQPIQKNFDSVSLDIDEYNIPDLEKLFGLSSNIKYKRPDIEQNEYTIIQKIINDLELNNITRKQIIDFYGKAKTKLINSVISQPIQSTTFQYGGREQLDSKLNTWVPNIPDSYSGGIEYGQPGSILDIFDPKTGKREQNEVVRHIDKEYINANVSDVYTGVINPLNTRFINKYLTIDSRFRDTPYTNALSLINSSSDFTIQLPDKIPRVISMQLSSLEIPITYYANSLYIGNNYMYIVIKNTNNNITSGVITIPDGTYTPLTIGNAITNSLIELGGLFSTITITYNNINGRFTIETTSSSISSFNIDFTTSSIGDSVIYNECNRDNINNCNPLPQIETIKYNTKNSINIDLTRRLGYSLGFLSGIYTNSKKYISEGIANTSGSRYIFLAIDDFNMNVVSNQFMTIAKQNISSKNILARITVGNGGFLSILSENDFKIITEPRKYFGPVDITRLRVQLYDDYGLLLNMNGSDFSFNLLLEVVYDL